MSETDLDKLWIDIGYLKGEVVVAYNQNGIDATNDETKRMWDVYEEIRQRCVEIDKYKFSSLRKISLPPPNNDNQYLPNLYLQQEVKPLLNEVSKLSSYFESFISRKQPKPNNSLDILTLLSDRFHRVVRQLRERYGNRPPLIIEDEYDFQYLLHALLNLYFDDIRPEEWTPSYAGGHSRVDFLLKNEKTLIELKRTRDTLKEKEIADQLIIDIDRYKVHPDCDSLFCFIYDPEARISNPIGLENDLSRNDNGFEVSIRIRPNI